MTKPQQSQQIEAEPAPLHLSTPAWERAYNGFLIEEMANKTKEWEDDWRVNLINHRSNSV